ncbi:holin-associated N-acetylmuramidase [Boseongicola aestuarii]|uniref:Putative Peptidoglycan domain protein n=1 Tax=Boseongicola aestuarii TaxID=1470561 RepID=A0A238IVR8_9RHOB|nr:holin-associated N-acetylmuramidase [Boseongicola aestuarii]SMX22103.1 putative Peptidoglycan domain protein [Boseongicola aestuarii]
MPTVHSIADAILTREGGFVNDPADPGGATKFGVTIHTLRRLGLDLTGDGRINVADVRVLSRAQARRIFIDHYFTEPRIGWLPVALQASVFDMNVNAGLWSIRLLQRLSSQMGFRTVEDGRIGPKTRAQVAEAFAAAPEHMADAYGIMRRNYYYRLADRRPASRKYARRRDGGKGGWITRAEEFIAPRYHLSDAEHAERTGAWD